MNARRTMLFCCYMMLAANAQAQSRVNEDGGGTPTLLDQILTEVRSLQDQNRRMLDDLSSLKADLAKHDAENTALASRVLAVESELKTMNGDWRSRGASEYDAAMDRRIAVHDSQIATLMATQQRHDTMIWAAILGLCGALAKFLYEQFTKTRRTDDLIEQAITRALARERLEPQ